MNNQQIFPDGRACLHARAAAINANLDGTGTLVPFDSLNGAGLQVTNIRTVSEDATPVETYNVFMDVPGDQKRLIWSKAITARITDSLQDDLYVPAGAKLYLTSEGG